MVFRPFTGPFVGPEAAPAGLSRHAPPSGINLCGNSPSDAIKSSSIISGQHAIKQMSIYAQREQPGWNPLEADVHPHQHLRSAGVTEVDNVYLPSPIKGKWGKTRELSPIEYQPVPRAQVSDVLSGINGSTMWGLPGGVATQRRLNQMGSVLQPFAPCVPLFAEKLDVHRFEKGFVRTPNVSRHTNHAAPLAPIDSFSRSFSPSECNPSHQRGKHQHTHNIGELSWNCKTLHPDASSRIPVFKQWLGESTLKGSGEW